MFALIASIVAAVAVAAFVYVGYERLGAAGLGMATMRAVGLSALALLLLNPQRGARITEAPPTILLDASLSLAAAGGHWREALDTARALAGAHGTILRFGARVTPLDTAPPGEGTSRLADALRVAHGRPGPVIVVTDGEVEDAGVLEPSLLADSRVVLLPRTSLPDVALLDAAVPVRLVPRDSLRVELRVAAFGAPLAGQATVEVALDGRVLARRGLDSPAPGGVARRHIAVPLPRVAAGPHLVSTRIAVAGDAEPRDDRREQWVVVAPQPDVVVLAAPADWEMRFLTRELGDIAPDAVRGYALVQPGRWVEMRTLAPAPTATVREGAAAASLVLVRGAEAARVAGERVRWRWLGGDSSTAMLQGDWYLDGQVPPSPLAGRLGSAAWDSVPPLVGLVPLVPAEDEWVALAARQGRRGPERPVVLGRDSAGVRRLTIAGEGLWRSALRGGAAREAYRSLVAVALDWLLRTETGSRRMALTASQAVPSGTPVAFRWGGDSIPDSLQVTLSDGRGPRQVTLRFDAAGVARVELTPGAYRWSAEAVHSSGVFVVETFSDEYHPRPVTLANAPGVSRGMGFGTHARQRLWLFALVVAAAATEWIGRHRRGLP